ncbi:MAG: GntP family permease [Kiritimatiellae bacterium]|nr:GntP family permease [Kiritimatiellia bacterium]
MQPVFSTLGATVGLALAIALVLLRMQPAYALIAGALLGGLAGGGGLAATMAHSVSGAQGMTPAILRILASGVLAGALIKTGSAERIARAIIGTLGRRFAVAAVAVATFVVCAVGVFVDISVITVAPVALAVARRANISVPGIFLAMTGGGKAGNIISPNPNTIATAEAFKVDLTALMAANMLPALLALAATVALAGVLARRGPLPADENVAEQDMPLPSLWTALAGPVTVIALLALRPLAGVTLDPFIALPLGGIVSIAVTGNLRRGFAFAEFGLSKVVGVAVLLIGTGTIAGIIKASSLQGDVVALLNAAHLPAFMLAPVSGVLMAGATASTTAGATIAAQTFSPALAEAGIAALGAAAMTHAGSTVIDSLPHGSFFHATGGAVFMNIGARLRIIPFEAAIGLVSTLASVAVYLVR